MAAVSSAVNAELAKITPQVRAAFAYLRPCIDRVRPVTHSGKWSGHEVVDRRRAQPGALGRVHPVGEVEHVEGRRASARPAANRPATRRCARRARPMNVFSRSSSGIPSSASRDRPPARRGGRGERDHLVAGRSGRLGEALAASRGCSCSRPSARARAARRRRRSSRVVVEVQEVGAERAGVGGARFDPRRHERAPDREADQAAPDRAQACSGTVIVVGALTGIVVRPTITPFSVATTVCGRVKRRGSPWSCTLTRAAGARDPLVGDGATRPVSVRIQPAHGGR